MNRTLIVNADDFGWTDGHNRAIEQACTQGILNRASLLGNGPAFGEAVEIAGRVPGLGVGVHLALNEGAPLLPAARLPRLAPAGVFPDSVGTLAGLWLAGRLKTEEAQAEWRAQIERVLRTGLAPTHLDSHKHVHLLPPLLKAIIALACEYRVPYVRLPLEWPARTALRRGPNGLAVWLLAGRARAHLQAAGLRFAERFFGFADSGALTGDRLAEAVRQAKPGVTEIMTHPAVITPAVAALRAKYGWAARYQFEAELQALCSLEIVTAFRQKAET